MSSCSSSSRSSQRRWSAPDSSARGPLDERHVPVAMARADELDLAVGLELLGGVRPDRVEQPEARLAVGDLLDLDQALVDERHQAVEDVAAELGRRPADRLRRGEVAAAREDRQPVEQPPAAVVEQVVAPGDRAAERLLARGQVARAGGQDVELVVEPGQDRVGRQDLDPRGGQLDRQRHAVQPGADGGDRRGVLVGHREARADRDGAFDEQPDGRVLAERDRVDDPRLAAEVEPLEPAHLARVRRRRQARDRVFLLARDVEDGAARDDGLDVRRGPQEVGHDRGRRDDLLEVVEDEQQALVAQPVGERLGDRPGARLGRRRAPSRSAARRASGRGSARAGTKKTPSGKSSAARAASWSDSRSCRSRPARSGSAAGSSRAARPPRRARRRGRRTSSAGSAGCSAARRASAAAGTSRGRPSASTWKMRTGAVRSLSRCSPRSRSRTPVERVVDEQAVGRPGREDLAAVGDRRDPGGPVDARARRGCRR